MDGGTIDIRKESWHVSYHDCAETNVSGWESTDGPFKIKILCYNSSDNQSVTVEVYLDKTNNNNDDFIASPKGTKPFPFIKKCRTIIKTNKTILITIPHEICHLLKIEEGDNFNVYCDIENNKIVSRKVINCLMVHFIWEFK